MIVIVIVYRMNEFYHLSPKKICVRSTYMDVLLLPRYFQFKSQPAVHVSLAVVLSTICVSIMSVHKLTDSIRRELVPQNIENCLAHLSVNGANRAPVRFGRCIDFETH